MKKLLWSIVLLTCVGCGSTGTEASGTGDDDTSTGPFCSGFQVGPGLICDSTTTPPTLRINFGSTPGTVADGGAVNPNKGKYLGSFNPSQTQGTTVTRAAPGGQIADPTRLGQIIYNQATGRVGIRAANEVCAAITDWPGKTAAVPTAHACTTEEIVANVNAGLIPMNSNGMSFSEQSFVTYASGTDATNNSWKASCAGWTYNSADIAGGTRWDVLPQTFRNNIPQPELALAVKFTSGQPCNTVLPIACCE